MSKTILAVFIQFAAVLLPMMGVEVGSEALTSALQTIIVVVTGIVIWVRRVQVGDVKLFGGRK